MARAARTEWIARIGSVGAAVAIFVEAAVNTGVVVAVGVITSMLKAARTAGTAGVAIVEPVTVIE